MKTYLVAHSNPDGTGTAQATIIAISERKAREKFEQLYPGRTIRTIGVEGQS